MSNTLTEYSCEEQSLREDLAKAYHLSGMLGWDDLIYTHISVRIPSQPDCYLINPFGFLFNEITPSNLLKVDFEGNIVGNNPFDYNPAGENIHGAIYKAREDVNAIVHLHTLNGMALSALKEGLLPICQQSCHFYGKIAYYDYHGIAVERDEQQEILNTIGDKKVMIMRNHGTLTLGSNIAEAFCSMHTLEKAATVQLMALSSGRDIILPTPDVCEKVINQTSQLKTIKNYEIEWNALVRLLKQKEMIAANNMPILFSQKHQESEMFRPPYVNHDVESQSLFKC
ncbi:MAG: L-fuculose phosphate aldolase [Holosporales bacterium]